jgi:arginase
VISEGPRFAIIDVPSNLGLRPSGVELLPDALRRAGLHDRMAAGEGGRLDPAAAYNPERATDTGLLNGPALRETAIKLAESISKVGGHGEVPIVLAGDCSVVLGGVLGLRQARRAQGRSDRVGLLFVDGHVDFYQPEASPTGEAADMDLALVTGRGPPVLTRLDGPQPLVRDEDVVAVGARDAAERDRAGAQDIRATAVHLFELDTIRARGMEAAATEAVALLTNSQLTGFWLHLDADVLDDNVMPAVDYRQPGGLTPGELTMLLRLAVESRCLAGVSVAIYNPALDPGGLAGQTLTDCIANGLAPYEFGDPDG